MTAKRSQYEHELEDAAARRFAERGHVLLKFHSPGFPGVPDRIALASTGRVAFIEFKAPGGPLRRTQPSVLAMLRRMGFRAEVVDTMSQIDQILAGLES